jgi:predicted Rossmann fold nucleotide-binding protein DprA/Smf involved in DNA uptake
MSLLMSRTGLDPAALAVELAHLELDGWVTGGGGWWQRLAGDGR